MIYPSLIHFQFQKAIMHRTMLDDLIKELQESRHIVGNVPVIVTGLYGSSADEIKVVTNMTDGNVVLETDICSG